MIRTVIGFLLVFGAVGGIDNATDAQLPALIFIGMLGLLSMMFGVQKISNKIYGAPVYKHVKLWYNIS
jgi:hypothetical protein